jgi:serine/threonine protein phosphatase PrpC
MAAAAALNPAHRWASRFVPLHEGEPCGDAGGHWALPGPAGEPPAHLLALIDGLGHGEPAAQAAQAAMHLLAAQAALQPAPPPPLPELMLRLDAALQATRGAAVGLACLQGRQLHYAGIGNTRALRWRGGSLLRLSSQYGIVGGGLREAVQVQVVDVGPGDWLLLFSDGLDEMIQLPLWLPEWERDPATLCDHLLTRWRQGRDDVGVLVVQLGAG